MINAICIGEALVELRPLGPSSLARGVAGDAYNTAVYLKRSLARDGEVSFLTVVGDDPLSDRLVADFRGQDIATGLVMTTPGALPGLYLIELDQHGDRSFHYWRGESAARRWMTELEESGNPEALVGADLIFVSGVSLAILTPEDRGKALALLASLKGRVGLIAFDPNVRPRLWTNQKAARETLTAACALADVVLASDVDGEWILDEADPRAQIALYRDLGCPEVAVTIGEDGVVVWAEGGFTTAPSAAREVVDTSGAGDSFNGAYLAARLRGASPAIAAREGQALAARVVATPGALIAPELSHPHIPTP